MRCASYEHRRSFWVSQFWRYVSPQHDLWDKYRPIDPRSTTSGLIHKYHTLECLAWTGSRIRCSDVRPQATTHGTWKYALTSIQLWGGLDPMGWEQVGLSDCHYQDDGSRSPGW